MAAKNRPTTNPYHESPPPRPICLAGQLLPAPSQAAKLALFLTAIDTGKLAKRRTTTWVSIQGDSGGLREKGQKKIVFSFCEGQVAVIATDSKDSSGRFRW